MAVYDFRAVLNPAVLVAVACESFVITATTMSRRLCVEDEEVVDPAFEADERVALRS